MERVSVREYARRRKLSIFQVIRKINRGELKSESVEENGVKVQYVLIDDSSDDNDSPAKEELSPESGAAQSSLSDEIALLRRRVEELEKIIDKCCKSHN